MSFVAGPFECKHQAGNSTMTESRKKKQPDPIFLLSFLGREVVWLSCPVKFDAVLMRGCERKSVQGTKFVYQTVSSEAFCFNLHRILGERMVRSLLNPCEA